MTRYLSGLFTILALTAAGPSRSGQSPEEFIAALRKGQARLAAAEAAASYQGKYETSVQAPGKQTGSKPRVARETCMVARRGSWVLLELQPEMPGAVGSIPMAKTCLTDDYTFAITGFSTTPEWSLVQYTRDNPAAAFRDTFNADLTAMVYPLRALTLDFTIDQLLASPTFVVRAVRTRPDGAVDADFSVSDVKVLSLGATMTADPQRDYLILECKSTVIDSKTESFRMTRILEGPGEPLRCKQLRFEVLNPETKEIFTDDYLFSDYTTEVQDKARFTLEHYGLGIPTDELPPLHTRWLFWALIAAAALALAMLFRWLARRKART